MARATGDPRAAEPLQGASRACGRRRAEQGQPHERTGLSPEALCERVRGLIVTLGAQGSCIYAEGRRYEIPAAKPRTVRDPTGCGDAYRAGLLRDLDNRRYL